MITKIPIGKEIIQSLITESLKHKLDIEQQIQDLRLKALEINNTGILLEKELLGIEGELKVLKQLENL